jgi:hypothetical protein
MAKNKFPMLATILLVFGIVWLLETLGYLAIQFPWLPVIVIIVSVGMIINRYNR